MAPKWRHLSQWKPCIRMERVQLFVLQPCLLDHRNGDCTHTPQSTSWRQSSKWSGLCENRWLHGSYNPGSFQMRLHLQVQKGKGEQRDTSASSIFRSSKEKEQRIWIVTLGTTYRAGTVPRTIRMKRLFPPNDPGRWIYLALKHLHKQKVTTMDNHCN